MTLNKLLDLPIEELSKLSTAELQKLLEPYFSAVRKAMLPPEGSKKEGLEHNYIKSLLANKELMDSLKGKQK